MRNANKNYCLFAAILCIALVANGRAARLLLKQAGGYSKDPSFGDGQFPFVYNENYRESPPPPDPYYFLEGKSWEQWLEERMNGPGGNLATLNMPLTNPLTSNPGGIMTSEQISMTAIPLTSAQESTLSGDQMPVTTPLTSASSSQVIGG